MTFANITTTPIDENFLKFWDGKVDPSNFTYSFFDGRFRVTPEALQDMESYFDISPDELMRLISRAMAGSFYKGEIEFRITNIRSLRPTKESLWQFQLVETGTKNELMPSVYFSGEPIRPVSLESSKA